MNDALARELIDTLKGMAVQQERTNKTLNNILLQVRATGGNIRGEIHDLQSPMDSTQDSLWGIMEALQAIATRETPGIEGGEYPAEEEKA